MQRAQIKNAKWLILLYYYEKNSIIEIQLGIYRRRRVMLRRDLGEAKRPRALRVYLLLGEA